MSMLRSVLTYMGLGPDEDYDDGYLYEADRRTSSSRPGRLDAPEGDDATDDVTDDDTIDLRDDDDPHAQRRRPEWLGGGEDEQPAMDATDGERPAVPDAPPTPPEAAVAALEDGPAPRGRHDAPVTESDDVRPLRAVPTEPDALAGGEGVRVRSVSNHGDQKRPAAAPRSAKATILAPRTFGDAKLLADEFKASAPVVMNLQEVDRELARRLIDFASGICYALEGGMEKLAPQVFLLIPDAVEVSAEERRRLEQLGFGR